VSLEIKINTFVFIKECEQLLDSIIGKFEMKRKTSLRKILKVGSSKVYNRLQIDSIKVGAKKTRERKVSHNHSNQFDQEWKRRHTRALRLRRISGENQLISSFLIAICSKAIPWDSPFREKEIVPPLSLMTNISDDIKY
jgi:hypothetical protein